MVLMVCGILVEFQFKIKQREMTWEEREFYGDK